MSFNNEPKKSYGGIAHHHTPNPVVRDDNDNQRHQFSERFISSNNFETTIFYDNNEGATNWLGIILALASSICFSISSSLVKYLCNVDPMILLTIRGFAQIATMLLIAFKNSLSLIGPKDQKLLIQLQGLLAGVMLSLLYYSYRKLPIGDATTIVFSSPAIVVILSFVFMNEPCGVLRIIVICLLSTGVVLIARPPFLLDMNIGGQRQHHKYESTGYACALLTTLISGINIMVLRKCSNVHYSIMIFNSSLWSIMASMLLFSFFGNINITSFGDPSTCLMIAATAIAGSLGQSLMVAALGLESAGKLSVVRTFDIVLAYVLQIWLFNDTPSLSCIVGALMILFSVVCMSFERGIYSVCDFVP